MEDDLVWMKSAPHRAQSTAISKKKPLGDAASETKQGSGTTPLPSFFPTDVIRPSNPLPTTCRHLLCPLKASSHPHVALALPAAREQAAAAGDRLACVTTLPPSQETRNSHKPTRDLSPPRELIEAPLHSASHPPTPPRLPVHLPETLRGPFLRDPFALSLHLRQPHLLASPATPAMTPLIAAARTAAAEEQNSVLRFRLGGFMRLVDLICIYYNGLVEDGENTEQSECGVFDDAFVFLLSISRSIRSFSFNGMKRTSKNFDGVDESDSSSIYSGSNMSNNNGNVPSGASTSSLNSLSTKVSSVTQRTEMALKKHQLRMEKIRSSQSVEPPKEVDMK
eukprot:CAMPEP_0170067346 /NCGR_PEP_ID=MMETSP0019_2-20121128/6729_1 /TAXON_ID=98059 /ORGANISM="Dinobryon sp., Strain UTEXLB2267" /LENGTH=336 /DNA_ID=CAMNT_0010274715 /DNA_START=607 /DNA_END=1619 /DNA_ORIENTATION=+